METQELIILIDQYAPAGGTDSEVAALINTAETITRNTMRVTTATLLDKLTPDEYGLLRTVLTAVAAESPYVAGINEALAGTGVSFSDDRSQGFIGQLRSQLGDVITDKLLALGVTRTPVVADPITAADVAAARAWPAVEAEQQRQVALANQLATELVEQCNETIRRVDETQAMITAEVESGVILTDEQIRKRMVA